MTPTVYAPHCLRNTGLSCTACHAVCPSGAISPGGSGVAIDTRACSGCGVCAVACPPSAISPHADNRFLAKRLTETQPRKTLVLACPFSGHTVVPQSVASSACNALATTGCPTALTPAAVAACAASGSTKLVVLHGKCATCRMGNKTPPDHIAVLWNALFTEKAAVLAIKPSAKGIPIHPIQTPIISRRFFFRLPVAAFAGEKHFGPLTALGGDQWQTSDHPTFRRVLRGILKKQPEVVRQDAAVPEALLPYSVSINPQSCIACGACARGCVSGALEHRPDAKTPAIHFTPGRCVRCGKCRTVCRTQSITLHSAPISFHDWLFKTIAFSPQARKSVECARCRAPFAPASPDDAYCPICAKRLGLG